MEKVELIPAFFWICDKCCNENFERAMAYECSKQEEQDILEEAGIEEEGHLLIAPEVVKCKNCQAEYETIAYNEI